MKRLFELLAIAIVGTLFVVPTTGTAHASPGVEARAAAAVSVKDIAKRARRVIGLANYSYRDSALAELVALADSDTVEFLRGHVGWVAETPNCKRSTLSRPGSTVWACRIAETGNSGGVPAKWWLYFRQVDGKWTAVNHRLASSAAVYRTSLSLAARTDKIMDAAWDQNWAAVAPYASAALLAELKSDIETSLKPDNPLPEYNYEESRSGGPCRQVRPSEKTLGDFSCGWLVAGGFQYKSVTYRKVSGHWLAVKTTLVVF